MVERNDTLKVFVANHSAYIRGRLFALLDSISMVKCVGEAEDALTAMQSMAILQPDLVFLYLALQKQNQFEILDFITHPLPHCKTVVLSKISEAESTVLSQ